MYKKRILLCNEASFIATGFATYGLEIMQRLYATGKYELAELACYGSAKDPRQKQLPWRYYPNLPRLEEEAKIYNSKTTNQWGEWMFESVCLDFKPDIVFDIRDWWMLEHQERSPFRNYFKWAIMPTVDAEPQDEQWLSTYMGADAVFAYSDWGLNLLNRQTNGTMKTIGVAPPGIDLTAYKIPLDKKAHRDKMGLMDDVYIIGTVMRNQKRKLYPDLIEAFAIFLEQAPAEIATKSYLYLHCAHPDLGWDIPRLIKEAGIANRCIFTYYCAPDQDDAQGCGAVFPAFFQDVVGLCRRCGQASAIMPRTKIGISRESLSDVIGLFDAYVQYASSEGFGLPQVEAAACGVPVFAVDYSAMSDVVRKIKGYPIKVERFFRESETHCYRALPDNNDLVRKLVSFFLMSEEERKASGLAARKAVEVHYNWDKTARQWEMIFDQLECPPQETTWASPAKMFEPSRKSPQHMSNEEFVRWGIVNIAGRPDLANSYFAMRMIRDLNWGIYRLGMGSSYFNDASTLGEEGDIRKFTRVEAANVLYGMAEHRNNWEQNRIALLGGK